MHYSKRVLLVFLVAVCCLALADEKTEKIDIADDRNSAAQPQQSSRLYTGALETITIPQGLVSFVTQGGFVAAGLFAIIALGMLIVPSLSNTRFCHMFNNCDVYAAYTGQGNSLYGDYRDNYGNGGTYNSPNYPQKRSIEYITPVLKAIGNAYDKYNQATGAAAAKKVA